MIEFEAMLYYKIELNLRTFVHGARLSLNYRNDFRRILSKMLCRNYFFINFSRKTFLLAFLLCVTRIYLEISSGILPPGISPVWLYFSTSQEFVQRLEDFFSRIWSREFLSTPMLLQWFALKIFPGNLRISSRDFSTMFFADFSSATQNPHHSWIFEKKNLQGFSWKPYKNLSRNSYANFPVIIPAIFVWVLSRKHPLFFVSLRKSPIPEDLFRSLPAWKSQEFVNKLDQKIFKNHKYLSK